MEKFTIKMDIRGFIRFNEEVAKELKLDKNPYADIEVDKDGKRIAVTPCKTIKTTSFRFMPNGTGYLLYFKGAMNAVGFKVVTGAYTMTKEGSKFVFTGKAQEQHDDRRVRYGQEDFQADLQQEGLHQRPYDCQPRKRLLHGDALFPRYRTSEEEFPYRLQNRRKSYYL